MNQNVTRDSRQTVAVPETIKYGDMQCQVVNRDQKNRNIVTIRYPDPPRREIRIVHPFGDPGKTLFLDGEECTVDKFIK